MVIGVANSVFLDTNILVYANVSESPFHQAALQAIENLYDTGIELWISRQVLREFLMTLSRPQALMNPRPVALIIEVPDFFKLNFE
ncbi:MAG: PIN domain-containing protein [Nostoc sp.]|uniref:type II toxin-antitoxin system VapC family toxin n=1 Tax=Nostoc sp. TaxID=1180 RepID=UPI002FF12BDC